MYNNEKQTKFKKNVVLIDADYVDSIAFNLSDTFEKMLGRAIPAVDLADWLVCAALDGGVEVGDNQVQCIFLHSKEMLAMEQFSPGELAHELDGTAFHDPSLGEFEMSCLSIDELASGDFFSECAQVLLEAKEVERLVLVPDVALSADRLVPLLKEVAPQKSVAVLSMTPVEGCPHVMLGYSLMHAMGIKSDEL